MSGTDDLSKSEIQEFISKVKSLPGCTLIQQDEAEKAACLYLRARKRDVERAVELYKANKRMRYTENVDSIDPFEEGVRRELLSGKFTVLPTLVDDDVTATVAVFTAHRHWPPLTTHRDTLKGVLYQLDAAMMDEQSQRKGLIVLYDMRDTKYSNFDHSLCIKLLNLFKGVYPARLRKVIIVEAPFWFRAPFNVLRFFVKEKMRDRIFTVDMDELHMHLPPSTLSRLFGQLTEHQHFDWLRTCLERTGHASQMPPDYFSCNTPSMTPLYYGLTQPGSDLVIPHTLPRHMGSAHLSSYGSLRYSTRTRRQQSQDDSMTSNSPPGIDSNGPKLVSNGLKTSPLSRRSIFPGRMTGSMYISSSSALGEQAMFPSTNIGDALLDGLNQSNYRSKAQNQNNLNLSRAMFQTNSSSQTRLSVQEFIERVQSIGNPGLIAEFESLFRDAPAKELCTRFALPANRRRNRYLDVPCLDESAVQLSDGTYLHANWVNGYMQHRAYILAQGPLENTSRDFWMAVWEYRVPTIIMLTKIIEGQRVKCSVYWPAENTSYLTMAPNRLTVPPKEDLDEVSKKSPKPVTTTSYGEFQVINRGESLEADGLYLRTRLELIRTKQRALNKGRKDVPDVPGLETSDKPLLVDHFLYLGWPDFDVPTNSDGFLQFLSEIRAHHEAQSLASPTTPKPNNSSLTKPSRVQPLLVHCSAGIGRTGTLVTIDICLQQAQHEGYVDVPAVVTELRKQRAGAVQVGKQYAFIHQALVSRLRQASHPVRRPANSDCSCPPTTPTISSVNGTDPTNPSHS